MGKERYRHKYRVSRLESWKVEKISAWKMGKLHAHLIWISGDNFGNFGIGKGGRNLLQNHSHVSHRRFYSRLRAFQSITAVIWHAQFSVSAACWHSWGTHCVSLSLGIEPWAEIVICSKSIGRMGNSQGTIGVPELLPEEWLPQEELRQSGFHGMTELGDGSGNHISNSTPILILLPP